MVISTKGRYALRVMVNLARRSQAYVPLKEIAEEEQISQKYLEAIMTTLSKAGMVDAVHGKGGGYRLNRSPEAYTVGSILKLTETSLAAVACTAEGAKACSRSAQCVSRPLWERLDKLIDDFLESTTLADLLAEQPLQI